MESIDRFATERTVVFLTLFIATGLSERGNTASETVLAAKRCFSGSASWIFRMVKPISTAVYSLYSRTQLAPRYYGCRLCEEFRPTFDWQARSPTLMQDSMLRACLQNRESQDGSAAPFLTLDDVRKLQYVPLDDVWKHQYSALANPTFETQHQRVRRRESKPNLTITTQLDPTIEAEHLSILAGLLPPSSPSCGSDMSRTSSMTSPSLTSTATTMSATPTQTPDSLGCIEFDPPCADGTIALVEPIRTKRRFPIYKSAKRLPRWEATGAGRIGSDGSHDLWEVHAVVVEPAIDFEALDHAERDRLLRQIVNPDVMIHQEATTGGLRREHLHGSHHHRKENVTYQSSRRAVAQENHTRRQPDSALMMDHEIAGDPRSPFAQFQFQFSRLGKAHDGETSEEEDALSPSHSPPVSPMEIAHPQYFPTKYYHHQSQHIPYDPIGLSPPSPSVSPAATLHYKGTSFDVVNPHASLFLGNHKFETPAEIDNIYNDYFDIDHPSSDDDSDDDMAIDGTISSQASQASLRSHSDSPRTRVLYDDAEAARREILSLKSYQCGPSLMATPKDASVERHGPLKVQQISQLHPRFSQKSEPFDLHVSDDGEDQNGHGHCGIDHVMHNIEMTHNHQERPVDTAAATPVVRRAPSSYMEEETDTTMREIIDGYDYTRSIRRASTVETKAASEPYSSTTKHNLERSASAKMYDHHSVPTDLGKENILPTTIVAKAPPKPPLPPAPVFNITNRRYGRHVETSDLPTSEQTYGETNQLLQITPSDRQIWPSNKRATSQRSAITHNATLPEQSSNHSNSDRPVSFLGTLPTWNSPELPRGLRSHESSQIRQEYGGKSWNAYPTDTDSAWETQISDSEPDLVYLSRLSGDSYADTSIDGSRIQLPYQLPSWATLPFQGEDDEKENVEPNGFVSPLGSSMTPKIMHSPFLKNRDTQLAVEFLQSQICANADNTIAAKEQRRVEARKLEAIRLRNPLAVRKATEHIYNRYSATDLHSMNAKLQASNLPKTPLRSRDSLRKIIAMSPTSERRRLLHSPMGSPRSDSPGPNGALAFSESANTFKTIRYGSPSPTPADMPIGAWSPMQDAVDWPLQPTGDRRSRGSLGFVKRLRLNTSPNEGPPPRSSLRSAMIGQTELRQLRLISGSISPQPTGRALTAEEMTHQQPTWTSRPRLVPDGVERSMMTSPPIHDPVARTWRPRIGALIGDRQPRALIRDQWDGHDSGVQAAHAFSRRYMLLTALCPFTALAFAWGHFDPIMARRTKYRFVEMSPKHKREALVKFLPIGAVVWIFWCVVVGVVVWVCTLRASGAA